MSELENYSKKYIKILKKITNKNKKEENKMSLDEKTTYEFNIFKLQFKFTNLKDDTKTYLFSNTETPFKGMFGTEIYTNVSESWERMLPGLYLKK